MKPAAKSIGLAIIGGGRVGLFRGEVASRHPTVGWIGLAEKSPNRAGEVAAKIKADFVTQDHRALMRRPEVTAAIIATDEHLHVDPSVAFHCGLRLVDFMGSYPPGDMALGELRGPMADETVSWLNRVAVGLSTPAATVAEAHNRLTLTKALDLSAKRKAPVRLPLDPLELDREMKKSA